MDIRIITLSFDEETEQFIEDPLREMLRHRRVIELNEHFFMKDGLPFLTIVAKIESAKSTSSTQEGVRSLGDKRRI